MDLVFAKLGEEDIPAITGVMATAFDHHPAEASGSRKGGRTDTTTGASSGSGCSPLGRAGDTRSFSIIRSSADSLSRSTIAVLRCWGRFLQKQTTCREVSERGLGSLLRKRIHPRRVGESVRPARPRRTSASTSTSAVYANGKRELRRSTEGCPWSTINVHRWGRTRASGDELV